jgi:hypothetical protein
MKTHEKIDLGVEIYTQIHNRQFHTRLCNSQPLNQLDNQLYNRFYIQLEDQLSNQLYNQLK